MNRISDTFEKLRQNSKKALIPFITAGHPHPLLTVGCMHSLVENGADIIELGMPFSDPAADGETIQQSSEKAIANGTNLNLVLNMVSEFRQDNTKTPIVLMGYLNPIEKKGYKSFVKEAADAGVDGLLIVDCPPEESKNIQTLLKEYGLYQTLLVAPTTNPTRLKTIASSAKGFVYCVALNGVTGAAQANYDKLFEQIARIKAESNIPVAVGFGVKDADSAVEIAKHADGVVIGSALVKTIDQCSDQEQINNAVAKFIQPIRTALDNMKQEI